MLVVTELALHRASPLVAVVALELLVIMAFPVKVVTEALVQLGTTA
jgi:hypothetical protein